MAEWGAVGLFRTSEALLAAVETLRGQGVGGVGALDAYAPHAVPGLARALGMPRSPLGAWTLAAGLLGGLAAFGCQYWTSAVNYPLMAGGKPPGAWAPLLPVTFEGAVLFAAVTAGVGMLCRLNGLPAFGHPILSTRAMRSITRDRYALSLEGDPEACEAALVAAGAEAVERVQAPVEGPPALPLWAAAALLASWVAAGGATWCATKLFPVLRPMSRMERQPRLGPGDESRFFADGRGLRLPVAGTVARGHMPLGAASPEAAEFLINPLPRTPASLAMGRAAFQERCAVCHGPLGDGRGSLGPAYGAAPANLLTEAVRGRTDGRLYWVIVKGQNAMPGHEADLDGDRRWALVHYLRALQRAGHARDADLPEGTP